MLVLNMQTIVLLPILNKAFSLNQRKPIQWEEDKTKTFGGVFQLKNLSTEKYLVLGIYYQAFFTPFLKNSNIHSMIAKGIEGNDKAGWTDLFRFPWGQKELFEIKTITSLSTSTGKGQSFLESPTS